MNADALVRAGEVIQSSVATLERQELRSLADRLDLDHHRPTAELRTAIRRELVGLRRPGR